MSQGTSYYHSLVSAIFIWSTTHIYEYDLYIDIDRFYNIFFLCFETIAELIAFKDCFELLFTLFNNCREQTDLSFETKIMPNYNILRQTDIYCETFISQKIEYNNQLLRHEFSKYNYDNKILSKFWSKSRILSSE